MEMGGGAKISYFGQILTPLKFKVEVNFMDDVGQTLLNWASAFGTQEMVEFLCGKAADVNKGVYRQSVLKKMF